MADQKICDQPAHQKAKVVKTLLAELDVRWWWQQMQLSVHPGQGSRVLAELL